MIDPKLVDFTDDQIYSGILSDAPDGLCQFIVNNGSTVIYYKFDDRIRFIMWVDANIRSSITNHIYSCIADGEFSDYSPYLGESLKLISFEGLLDGMTEYPELSAWVLFNLDRFEGME